MKLERYLVKTNSESVEHYEVWNSEKPFYFGYPLKWVLEKKGTGLRVREIQTSIGKISQSFIKDFTEIKVDVPLEIDLPADNDFKMELTKIKEFIPLYSVIQKELVDSQGTDKFMVVRTVDSWVEDTLFFDDSFEGISKNEKLFKIIYAESTIKIIWHKNGLQLETHKGVVKQSKKNDVFEMPKDEFIGSKIFLPEVQWYFGLCRSTYLPAKISSKKSVGEFNDGFLFSLLFIVLFFMTSVVYYFHESVPFDPFIKKVVEKEVKELDFAALQPTPEKIAQYREAIQRSELKKTPPVVVAPSVPVPVPVPLAKQPEKKALEKRIAPSPTREQIQPSKTVAAPSAFDQLISSLKDKQLTQKVTQNSAQISNQIKSPDTSLKGSIQAPSLVSNESKKIQEVTNQNKLQNEIPLDRKQIQENEKLLSQNMGQNNKPLYEKAVSEEKLNIKDQGSTFIDIRPADSKVSQGLSKEEVDQVVMGDFHNIRNCYQTAMLGGLTQEGVMNVSFVISSLGKVTNPKVSSKVIQSQSLETCVLSRVKSWIFPQPVGGVNVQVNYPIQFSKKESGL